MPQKPSVGLNKKIGQPDYGSLGANYSVDLTPKLAERALHSYQLNSGRKNGM